MSATMGAIPRWRSCVACGESIARFALGQSGGHVAATRVLYDGLFETPDRALLVVAVERDGRRGVVALADRSGRVFSDHEVTVAEDVARADDGADEAIAHLLRVLGGETAALYAISEDGAQLALRASAERGR